MAIGSRSQSARTYLEKRLADFPEASLEEIVKHGLRALRDTLPNDSELTTKVRYSYVLTVSIQSTSTSTYPNVTYVNMVKSKGCYFEEKERGFI